MTKISGSCDNCIWSDLCDERGELCEDYYNSEIDGGVDAGLVSGSKTEYRRDFEKYVSDYE